MSVAFSPGGAVLASVDLDGKIHLWHAVPLRDRIGAIRARRAELDEMKKAQAPNPPADAADSLALPGGDTARAIDPPRNR
jgi:hypothetical protein